MQTPKLLPWYASKAGVSTERAAVLWRRAVRQATADTGWVGNSEYWGAAMDSFLRQLEEEKNSRCTPRVTPLLRSQNMMWRLPLLAMEDVVSVVSAEWQKGFQRGTGRSREAA
ncbi:hypothetical protein GPA19_02630 [Azoarcus indigens]|uniref:Uncharacterized protein n=1 Tax=Azoarcus indigens TaxID=29545 RepID=A0A4V3BNA8_9RHOO|nr:hypothetical protein [Azoarcus indigens]NMG63843.1 hypothetical protein [Azoarcus indigens]TDN53882.1 hypothetical protein C7389_104237 [Azoarcus indigens]